MQTPTAINGCTAVNEVTMCTENEEKIILGPRTLTELNSEITDASNVGLSYVPAYTLEEYRLSPSLWSFPGMREEYRKQIKDLSLIANYDETLKLISRIQTKNNRPRVHTESSVGTSHDCPMLEIWTEASSGSLSSGLVRNKATDIRENVEDTTGGGSYTSSAGWSRNYNQGQRELMTIDDFFRRPVEIDSFNISIGTSLSTSYPVWDLYTLNPAVRSKLRNYSYLTGNLHVVVAVSGSPFHYGRLLLSYQPYPQRNLNISNHEAAISISTSQRPLFLNYLSQAPGSVTLDVKNNKPIEMICPFISTKPMHRLFNSDAAALAGASSYHDLEEAGSLYIYSINDINAVTTTASPVSVQIYAYMTEVQLGCPTATQVGVITEAAIGDSFDDDSLNFIQLDERCVRTEADEKGDEIDRGPVERFTSGAANVANALSVIPAIAPLAKASGMVFSGLSSLCAYFGWSRPVIIDNTIFVKNRPFCSTAQTIGSETVEKISLVQKQELTVDPRCVASEHDEMTIKYICAVESYLETFSWAPTDTLMASSIWKCRINPALDTIFRDTTKDYYQPTALSFASSPFRFWRGDITYRFEIVCSAYHRGKLAFYYEPNIAQEVLIDADISLNKNFVHILDIQETQCIEFCIGWASPRAWNLCLGNGSSILNTVEFSPSGSSYEYVNGYIGVVPFTDLQSPDDSTIEINVYVRSDDMHFNCVTAQNLPTERLVKTECEEVSCFDLNESSASLDYISDFHFGEEPLSFRSVLKRYSMSYEETIGAGLATDVSVKVVRNIFPVAQPAYGASGYTDGTILEYLPYAYLGMRGGIRKRLRLRTDSGVMGTLDRVVVSLVNMSTSTNQTLAWDPQLARTFQRGSAIFVPDTNGGVEVEFPFYTNNYFIYSFCDDYVGTGNEVNDMVETWYKRYMAYFDTSDNASTINTFQEDTATAEDFTFLRYMGAPFYSKDPVI